MVQDFQRHLDVFKANVVDLVPEEELAAKIKDSLANNKPLRLKIGFDPTASDIHLGHTVLLKKLRTLQDLGHIVLFIVGDFTAKIGDPSGRTALRPVLSDKEIKKNASTYTTQAFKILDKKKTKIIYNSIWYKNMKVSDFLSLLSSYTVARMLERDDFTKRMKENKPLAILEMVYPLIQGFDSVKCQADVEFGGTDQKFNLLVGRTLQEVYQQKPQAAITMPLLVGLDGVNKMSKSLDNYIGITEKAKDIFGKVMSISDEVMIEYYRLLTDNDIDSIKLLHPKEAKLQLAQEIVSFYHGKRLGNKERKEFERIFSQKELPVDMPEIKVSSDSIDVVEIIAQAKLIKSKNEIRRLLKQSAISAFEDADTQKQRVVASNTIEVPSCGLTLKIGKRKFLKVTRT